MKRTIQSLFIALSLTSISFGQALKPKMMIDVSVSGVPASEAGKLSGRFMIDEKGYLRLPMLEGIKIKASGSSNTTVALRIAKAYKDAELFTSPVFTVLTYKNREAESLALQVRQKAIADAAALSEEKKVLFVEGLVGSPGKHRFVPGMTVRTLLAQVGGVQGFGSKRRFTLNRGGKTTKYNYHKKKGNPAVLDIRLKIGDIIKVPEGTLLNP